MGNKDNNKIIGRKKRRDNIYSSTFNISNTSFNSSCPFSDSSSSYKKKERASSSLSILSSSSLPISINKNNIDDEMRMCKRYLPLSTRMGSIGLIYITTDDVFGRIIRTITKQPYNAVGIYYSIKSLDNLNNLNKDGEGVEDQKPSTQIYINFPNLQDKIFLIGLGLGIKKERGQEKGQGLGIIKQVKPFPLITPSSKEDNNTLSSLEDVSLESLFPHCLVTKVGYKRIRHKKYQDRVRLSLAQHLNNKDGIDILGDDINKDNNKNHKRYSTIDLIYSIFGYKEDTPNHLNNILIRAGLDPNNILLNNNNNKDNRNNTCSSIYNIYQEIQTSLDCDDMRQKIALIQLMLLSFLPPEDRRRKDKSSSKSKKYFDDPLTIHLPSRSEVCVELARSQSYNRTKRDINDFMTTLIDEIFRNANFVTFLKEGVRDNINMSC